MTHFPSCSPPHSLTPLSPIGQDWSIPVDQDAAGIEWHVPSLEELKLVDRILVELLWPEMEHLREFMAGAEIERYVRMYIHT